MNSLEELTQIKIIKYENKHPDLFLKACNYIIEKSFCDYDTLADFLELKLKKNEENVSTLMEIITDMEDSGVTKIADYGDCISALGKGTKIEIQQKAK